MIVVVSSPLPIENESQLINQLFESGLEYFHLRKPDYEEIEIVTLLNEVKSEFHKKISLHNQIHLADEFNMKRIHFNEFKRESKEQRNYGSDWIKSTSIHSDSDISDLLNEFNYCFYGPVFNSISKEGYGKINSLKIDHIRKAYNNKIIAIGGVDEENLEALKKEEYDGIALLGSIWQQPEHAISNYKKIRKKWMN